MSLARRLPMLLLATGVVMFVVGLVLGLRPITVELVTAAGPAPDMSLSCGTHFAPNRQPYPLDPGSDFVTVAPDANFRADSIARFCDEKIARTWIVVPWLMTGVGIALIVGGVVLLARRQGARQPAG